MGGTDNWDGPHNLNFVRMRRFCATIILLIAIFAGFITPAAGAVAGFGSSSFAANAGALRFSQTTASPLFSEAGTLGGRSIASVADDLAAGVLKPSSLPVEYLVRDENSLPTNTRSSLALKQTGIPQSSCNLINRTGVELAEAAMTQRLLNNSLGSGGTDVLRITGAGKVRAFYDHEQYSLAISEAF